MTFHVFLVNQIHKRFAINRSTTKSGMQWGINDVIQDMYWKEVKDPHYYFGRVGLKFACSVCVVCPTTLQGPLSIVEKLCP